MPTTSIRVACESAGITRERFEELKPLLEDCRKKDGYRRSVVGRILELEGTQTGSPGPTVRASCETATESLPRLVRDETPNGRDFTIGIVSDLHCGHVAGLTPPAYQLRENPKDKTQTHNSRAQAEAWEWYVARVKSIGKVDALLINGDCIDGDGSKSGGTELLTTDRQVQAQMALECIQVWDTDTHLMTYGTDYHTGNAEQYENDIAKELGCKIGTHEWPRVNGVTIDIRHHVGSSSVPYGRHTPAAKEHLWNILWSREEAQPEAQVVIRSHVHYHAHAGGTEAGRQWLALTTPALQLAKTRFGGKRCSGVVHFGFLVLTIHADGTFTWRPHVVKLEHDRAQAYDLCA